MNRRTLLLALAVLMVASLAPAAASANGWSVYIYNTRRPYQGVFRAGTDYRYKGLNYREVYTTKANCLKAIDLRIKDNRKDGHDFEDFYIAEHTRYPDEGALTNKYLIKSSVQRIYVCPRPRY